MSEPTETLSWEEARKNPAFRVTEQLRADGEKIHPMAAFLAAAVVAKHQSQRASLWRELAFPISLLGALAGIFLLADWLLK